MKYQLPEYFQQDKDATGLNSPSITDKPGRHTFYYSLSQSDEQS